MKKYNAIQMVFIFIAIVLVLIVGIVSILLSTKFLTIKMHFNLIDTNLKVSISAQEKWTGENKTFETRTGTSGLVVQEWNLPNIVFSTTEQDRLVETSIELTIHNENKDSDINIKISGIAEDKYSNDPRFMASITCSFNSDEAESYTLNEVKTNGITLLRGSLATITIKYELLKYNTSFKNIANNIVIDIDNQSSISEQE